MVIQEPGSAKFDGMPMSAFSTGLADLILPPAEMGKSLVSFFKHPYISGKNLMLDTPKEGDTNVVLDEIFKLLKQESTINFSQYKASTVARRIERRLGINQLNGLSEYHRLLLESPKEIQILSKELLIGVTRFFRDEQVCEGIIRNVVPGLVKRAVEQGQPVRVWVAGCSTGEEAYSIAIMFREYIDEHNLDCRVNIFATDVDASAITEASAGMYSLDIQHEVTRPRLEKYFTLKSNQYSVSAKIREMVIFASHNMLEDPPFSNIDLVTCRNVLIYFQQSVQKRVLSSLFFALKNQSILWLGPSESLGDLSSHFDTLDERKKIFRKISNQRVPVGNTPPGLSLPGRSGLSQSMQSINLSTRMARNGVSNSLQNVLNRLVKEYAPDCIVVNDHFEALHVFGDVSRYTKGYRPGKISNNIKDIIVDDLSVPISTALYRCEKTEDDIFYSDVAISTGKDESLLIDLSVLYVREREIPGAPVNYIVQFYQKESSDEVSAQPRVAYDAAEHSRQRIRDLEQELLKKQEHLQVTIEELETTNEELQSANEELMSANEELQSTNEELQSVNEELYTVNSEYQEKISELTEVNDDLDSVINATNIGIVFLDETLAIRKFTPMAKQYIHLMESDVGRPFHHISHDLNYDQIVKDIADVSKSGEVIERSVFSKSDHALLVRVLPYQNSGGSVQSGVVLTLTNISRQRFVEAALEKAQDRLRTALLDNNETLMPNRQMEVKILILEDDEVDLRRVKRMLDSVPDRSFLIESFSTIQEAVKAAVNNKYDICLIDYRLPEGTAKDFADTIRSENITTPLVLMSGYSEVNIEAGFLDADIFDFLNKDELTTQLLVRSIDYAIERKQLQQTLEAMKETANEPVESEAE